MPDLLEVRDLHVSFGTEAGQAHVLDGVNLTIRSGEIMGLVGESGCGKTTLARSVLGILPPNAQRKGDGVIRFGSENLLDYSPQRFDSEIRGRRITFIPQDPFASLNPLFKVGNQMMELMKWKSPRRPPPMVTAGRKTKTSPNCARSASRRSCHCPGESRVAP